MASVFRRVRSVVAGFVVASVVMMAVEWANGRFFYPEVGAAAKGLTDPEAVRQLFATVPVGSLLVVVVGWALGSIAGGFVAAKLADGSPRGHALAVGILLTMAGIANNLMLPPPLWFWVAGLVVFVPAALFGGQLTGRT
jgi:hypothetical protein